MSLWVTPHLNVVKILIDNFGEIVNLCFTFSTCNTQILSIKKNWDIANIFPTYLIKICSCIWNVEHSTNNRLQTDTHQSKNYSFNSEDLKMDISARNSTSIFWPITQLCLYCVHDKIKIGRQNLLVVCTMSIIHT